MVSRSSPVWCVRSRAMAARSASPLAQGELSRGGLTREEEHERAEQAARAHQQPGLRVLELAVVLVEQLAAEIGAQHVDVLLLGERVG